VAGASRSCSSSKIQTSNIKRPASNIEGKTIRVNSRSFAVSPIFRKGRISHGGPSRRQPKHRHGRR
jgi:hypothetical protein